MTARIRKLGWLAGLALVVTGCGLEYGGRDIDREYSLDGVKLIGPNLGAMDPNTFTQMRYTVGPQRRLLLRFEELADRVWKIKANEKNEVFVKIWITATSNAENTAARSALRICPLTRNWMMAASWERAHPYIGGSWTPGGEIDDKCIPSMPADPDADVNLLQFKVTRWFLDYPVARNVNYGFALLADEEIQIYGDRSSSQSPRMGWREY